MDPTLNPTPTPTPTPTPVPEPNPVPPVAPAEPVAPPVPPVEPVAPAAPVEPVAPVVPVEPVAPIAPVEPVAPAAPEPVAAPAQNPTPVNPIYQPGGEGFRATDPIMMPEPAKAPDPIEEELNAPMRAADPVPGSIGSAVSGTPNVAFNDPANQPDSNIMMQQNAAMPGKKPTNRTTLIILIAVAAIAVIALSVVLVMQLMGGSSSPAPTPTPTPEPETQEEVSTKVLDCTKAMDEAELTAGSFAAGESKITAEYDGEGLLSSLSLVKTAYYDTEKTNSIKLESVEVQDAESMSAEEAAYFKIDFNEDGVYATFLDDLRENYESLDYTCELL